MYVYVYGTIIDYITNKQMAAGAKSEPARGERDESNKDNHKHRRKRTNDRNHHYPNGRIARQNRVC